MKWRVFPAYGELEAYVRAFAAGHLHLLLLFGPPGAAVTT